MSTTTRTPVPGSQADLESAAAAFEAARGRLFDALRAGKPSLFRAMAMAHLDQSLVHQCTASVVAQTDEVGFEDGDAWNWFGLPSYQELVSQARDWLRASEQPMVQLSRGTAWLTPEAAKFLGAEGIAALAPGHDVVIGVPE